MKIKTLLQFGIIASFAILLVLGMWVFSINQTYTETKENTIVAQEISDDILYLNTLTSDYLLYYQERAYLQWKEIHSRLSKELESNSIDNVNDFVDINALKKMHERSFRLFERLHEGKSNNQKNKNNSILRDEQNKALTAQLLTTTQLMSLMTKKLIDSVRLKRTQLEQQLYWLALIIFVIFVITLITIWISIAYRIVIPVRLLKEHISKIDSGNLNEKIVSTNNDEIGELATSFNKLTDKLFTTTVSKEKLAKEIQERKKTKIELDKQQSLNTTVLEGAGNIITILDPKGCFVSFNHSAEKLTGFSRDELIGKPVWDFVIPEEEREDVKNIFNALLEGNLAVAGSHENHWLTKSGEYRLIDWHNTVVRSVADEITHVVAIGYDITEKRFNEIEKQRIQRELNQSRKMEALGKLTGGIAHDFNNMLGIIIGYTDLALQKSENDNNSPINSCLDQIRTASNRAKDLIAKMLSFSRVDQAASHSLQLAPLFDENILLMNSILPSTIKLEVSKENNVKNIMMDPVQFQQILMNLILNAKDAMDGVGEINVSLSNYISSDEECSSCHKKITGNWVEVIVADNGCGMSKEVEERIFDPFFTTKGLGQGTGMGLSVLHGIVKGHDGHIIVESVLGKGTRFRLLFPAIDAEDNLLTTDIENNQNIIHGSGQRILIVDDQVSLADIEYDLLTSYGYECTKKYDSEEALNFFLSEPDSFDLIITDQTMPNLTGLELIDCIRENKIDIPIIIVTGYSEKIKDNKLDMENVTLLLKPVETKKLLANVAGLLGLSES